MAQMDRSGPQLFTTVCRYSVISLVFISGLSVACKIRSTPARRSQLDFDRFTCSQSSSYQLGNPSLSTLDPRTVDPLVLAFSQDQDEPRALFLGEPPALRDLWCSGHPVQDNRGSPAELRPGQGPQNRPADSTVSGWLHLAERLLQFWERAKAAHGPVVCQYWSIEEPAGGVCNRSLTRSPQPSDQDQDRHLNHGFGGIRSSPWASLWPPSASRHD